MREPAVAFGVERHALVGGFEVIPLEGLGGQAPAQYVGADREEKQWKEVAHGMGGLCVHITKAASPFKLLFTKRYMLGRAQKKAPRARRLSLLPLSLNPP